MVAVGSTSMKITAVVIAIALILSQPADSVSNSTSGASGTRPVLKSCGVGSPNATYTVFDDLKQLADSILTVRSITIASFYQLDSIQFTYTLKNGSLYRPPKRGEGFTAPETIKLAKNE